MALDFHDEDHTRNVIGYNSTHEEVDINTSMLDVNDYFAAVNISTANDPSNILAQHLVEQLTSHHGCSHEKHTRSDHQSSDATCFTDMLKWKSIDVLQNNHIATYPMNWDSELPVLDRKRLYTGLDSMDQPKCQDACSFEKVTMTPAVASESPNITVALNSCLTPDDTQVRFDIDSAGGFASSLAVAKNGFQWKAPRPLVSTLRSSLHLEPIAVQWMDETSGKMRHKKQYVHQLPHLPFGRLCGFSDVELFLIFPRLYTSKRHNWVITIDEYTLWIDEVFLPALEQHCPASVLAHLPSTASHIMLNASSTRVENRTQSQPEQARIQDLHYTLQSNILENIWNTAMELTEKEGLWQFQDVRLLLTVKNIKLATQNNTWNGMCTKFFSQWTHAVDNRHILEDFFDIGKEVTPPQLSSMSNNSLIPFTLTWRHCCLNTFCDWLQTVNQEVENQNDDNTLSNHNSDDESLHPGGIRRSERLLNLSARETPLYASKLEQEATGMLMDHNSDDDYAEGRSTSSTSTSADNASPSGESWTAVSEDNNPWTQTFYPFSFLRDMGSMTIQPKISSPIYKAGLYYAQFYNTSKEIFAVGQHSIFQNKNLDGLALDPNLIKAWEHIGKGLSQNPLTLLRAYIHTKQRCHAAINGCLKRSYGTREEYRVTGTVFAAMNNHIHRRHLATIPMEITAQWAPFFCHSSSILLRWVYWNINKLCLGFEMTFSLQPRTIVHWEHTRVMMMFLRCLLCAYGGQGNHISHSNGLWIDVRTEPLSGDPVTIKTQEGLGMSITLEKYGYAWFLNKLDWYTMTFKPPHRANMVFNTPTLQSSYQTRYHQLLATKRDFMFFHDIFGLLGEHHLDQRRSRLLLQVLVDACLKSFRKDVFTALFEKETQEDLNDNIRSAACAGLVPLTLHGLQKAFQNSRFGMDLHFIHGPKIKIKGVEPLFAMLWGWAGDGNNGNWPRKHWENKPYRVLFRQAFDVVTQVFGLQQAWEWRTHLKSTFIRTHWILPYPSSTLFWPRGSNKRLQTWATVHPLLVKYFKDHQPLDSWIIQPYDVEKLPLLGWQSGPKPMPLGIQLPVLPKDVHHWLVESCQSVMVPEAIPRDSVPLLAGGMQPSSISEYLSKASPEQRILRSYLQKERKSSSQIHTDSVWLTQHLVQYLEGLVAAGQQHVQALTIPPKTRHWQSQRKTLKEHEITTLNAQLNEDALEQDDDPHNVHNTRAQQTRRLQRMKMRLEIAQKELQQLLSAQNEIREIHRGRKHANYTKKEWKTTLQRYQRLKDKAEKSTKRLSQVSLQSTARVEV